MDFSGGFRKHLKISGEVCAYLHPGAPGNTSTLASYTLCCYAWYLAFEVTWLPASFHDMELGEN